MSSPFNENSATCKQSSLLVPWWISRQTKSSTVWRLECRPADSWTGSQCAAVLLGQGRLVGRAACLACHSQHHCGATTVLSRSLAAKSIYLAGDVLDSTSTLLQPWIVGQGQEYYACVQKVQETGREDWPTWAVTSTANVRTGPKNQLLGPSMYSRTAFGPQDDVSNLDQPDTSAKKGYAEGAGRLIASKLSTRGVIGPRFRSLSPDDIIVGFASKRSTRGVIGPHPDLPGRTACRCQIT